MLKIGVTQLKNSTSIEDNFNSIMGSLALFEKSDMDLILFPECSLSGFSAAMKECTLDLIQPYLSEVESWSQKYQKHVALPTALVEGNKIFNTGFLFGDDDIQRFYKLGLTESEQNFFSIPDKKTKKVFNIKGYNVAMIICYEAEMDPWKFFAEDEVDVILWPGYWGWNKGDTWQEYKKDNEACLIYKNVTIWNRPIIQSNFAYNDLSDYRDTGPHGMSMFVNSDNTLAGCGDYNSESCYEVHISNTEIKTAQKIGEL